MPTLKPNRSLSKPVALPQIKGSYDSAFLRAWAPELEDYGVPQPVWLQFLQGLENCMAASAPLQCIDRSAQGLSVEAYHWTVSGPISTMDSDRPGTRLLKRSLTEQYLHRANAEMFDARGLKARLIRGNALQKFIKLLNPTSAKAKTIAKGSEKVVRSIPIVGLAAGIVLGVGKGVASAVTPVANLANQSLYLQGVLGPLASNVARLQVDATWPSRPLQLQDAGSSLSQTLQTASAKKREAEQSQRQRLAAIDRGDLTIDESTISASIPEWHSSRDQRRQQRREARHLRNAQYQQRRDMRRGYFSTANSMASNNGGQQSFLPPKEDRSLWLVIYPVEQDKWINNVHKLDSTMPIEIDEDGYEDILQAETVEDLRYGNI